MNKNYPFQNSLYCNCKLLIISAITVLYLFVVLFCNTIIKQYTVAVALHEILTIPFVLTNVLLLGIYAWRLYKRNHIAFSLIAFVAHLILLVLMFWFE